jgi:hypothetical protein
MVEIAIALMAASPQGHTVSLKPPVGWARREGNGEVDLIPPGVPPGVFAELQFWPSQETDNFPLWVERTWIDLKGKLRVAREFPPYAANLPDHQLAVRAASMEAGNGRFLYAVFAAAYKEGRVQPVAFLVDETHVYNAHKDEAEAAIQSIVFLPPRNWPPPAPPGSRPPHPYRAAAAPATQVPARSPAGPAPLAHGGARADATPSFAWGDIPRATGNAGLDGMYTALLWHTNWSGTWIEPKHDYFVFFPDGRVTRVLPDEGLKNFNWDHSHQMNPMFFGHYDLASGQITWDGGGGGATVEKVKDGLRINHNGPFHKMERCDGLKMEGTYRRGDWETLVGQGKDAYITFHADGSFEEQNTLVNAGANWWRPHEQGGYFNEEYGPPGRGRYEIGDYSLTLLYDSGKRRRINWHLAEGASCKDPRGFVINTWMFKRMP